MALALKTVNEIKKKHRHLKLVLGHCHAVHGARSVASARYDQSGMQCQHERAIALAQALGTTGL
jgi:hypothetical protein